MYKTSVRALMMGLAGLTIASPITAAAQSASQPLTISRPEPGLVSTAYVGGAVWTSETQRVLGGARVTVAVRQRKFIDVYEVPAYAPLVQQKSKAAFKGCVAGGACLLDDDGDGRFDRIAEDEIGRAFKLDAPVAYERTGVLEPGSKIKREIRLLDVNSQVIRFSYGEVVGEGSFGQPDEIVTIDRRASALPATVSIRQVRLTVTEASSDGIKYRIDQASSN